MISFIIPTVNQYDLLFECINSLTAHHEGLDHEIIVVDDGSDKGIKDRVRAECRKRRIAFHENRENLGFSRTVNKGIEYSKGEYVVLVNNDVSFTTDIITPLIKAFKRDTKVGVVGALLYYPDGRVQHAGMDAPAPGIFEHRRDVTIQDEYLIAVTGAIFAIRRQTFQQIGLLKEDYFLSCEDTEYCLRAWKNGWRVLYSPEVTAIHMEGKTRGATDYEKKRDHHEWWKKERETALKFQADITNIYAPIWNSILKDIKICRRENNVKYPHNSYGEENFNLLTCGPMAMNEILIVKRTGALGDVILTTGLIRKIKEEKSNVDIFVNTKCPEVFRDNPYISGLNIDESLGHLINLDNAYESKPHMPILEAYVRYTVLEGRFSNTVNIPPELYSNESDYYSLKSKMGAVRLEQDKIALIHAGVGWPSRTLDKRIWEEVANRLKDLGYKCVVIGRGGDYRLTNTHNMVDWLSIHEIRELMKVSQVFIGMDSGMMHVAFTTNIPVVGIFSIANPDYRVVKRCARTVALIPKVECKFCLHRAPPPVNFIVCQYNTNACMKDFDSEIIVNGVKDVTL